MIQDLHSHTYYSFCGKDAPETVIEAAIDGGIELFGIDDLKRCRVDAFYEDPAVVKSTYVLKDIVNYKG